MADHGSALWYAACAIDAEEVVGNAPHGTPSSANPRTKHPPSPLFWALWVENSSTWPRPFSRFFPNVRTRKPQVLCSHGHARQGGPSFFGTTNRRKFWMRKKKAVLAWVHKARWMSCGGTPTPFFCRGHPHPASPLPPSRSGPQDGADQLGLDLVSRTSCECT